MGLKATGFEWAREVFEGWSWICARHSVGLSRPASKKKRGPPRQFPGLQQTREYEVLGWLQKKAYNPTRDGFSKLKMGFSLCRSSPQPSFSWLPSFLGGSCRSCKGGASFQRWAAQSIDRTLQNYFQTWMSKNQKNDRYQWMLGQPFFRRTTGMTNSNKKLRNAYLRRCMVHSSFIFFGEFSWDIMRNVWSGPGGFHLVDHEAVPTG